MAKGKSFGVFGNKIAVAIQVAGRILGFGDTDPQVGDVLTVIDDETVDFQPPAAPASEADSRVYVSTTFDSIASYTQETGSGGTLSTSQSGFDLSVTSTAGSRARLRKDIENISKEREPRVVTEAIITAPPTAGTIVLAGIGYTGIAAAGFNYLMAGQACIRVDYVGGVGTLKASSTDTNTQETTTIAGVDLSAYHTYDVRIFADRVEFYVDGILKATHTVRVPANLNDWDNFPSIGIANNNTTNAGTVRFKYMAYGMQVA